MIYNSDNTNFKEIDHTADIGICAHGINPESVFAGAAFGMRRIIYGDIDVCHNIEIFLCLESDEKDTLLVEWLSELNYRLTTDDFLFDEFSDMHIREQNGSYLLTCYVKGDKSQNYTEKMKTEVKAVTYHQLSIKKTKNKLTGKVIFDI